MLHGMDNLAIKGVTFTRFAVPEQPANRQIGQIVQISCLMQGHQPGLNPAQAKAGNP